jgi:hypothetical protein
MVVNLVTTIPNLYGIRGSLPNIQKRATAFRPEPDQSHPPPTTPPCHRHSYVFKVTASDFPTRIFYAFTFPCMLQTLHISHFLTLSHSTIWWKFELRHLVFMAINYFVTRHDIRYQNIVAKCRTLLQVQAQAVFPAGDRTTAEHYYRCRLRLCSQLAIAQLQNTTTGAGSGCVPNWR